MATISDDDVRHVAKLARLYLSDEQVKRFASQLSAVFEYMEVLNEVDTEGVEPTCQVTGLTNGGRSDEVERYGDPQEWLACSELPIQRNQIKVKSVM